MKHGEQIVSQLRKLAGKTVNPESVKMREAADYIDELEDRVELLESEITGLEIEIDEMRTVFTQVRS